MFFPNNTFFLSILENAEAQNTTKTPPLLTPEKSQTTKVQPITTSEKNQITQGKNQTTNTTLKIMSGKLKSSRQSPQITKEQYKLSTDHIKTTKSSMQIPMAQSETTKQETHTRIVILDSNFNKPTLESTPTKEKPLPTFPKQKTPNKGTYIMPIYLSIFFLKFEWF